MTKDAQGRAGFIRLRAMLSAENSALLEQLISANFDASSRSFVDALTVCLPHLTREDVLWRFHFLLGSVYYTGMGPHRIFALSGGACDPSDPTATAAEMVPFLAAGFRAPSTARTKSLKARKKAKSIR